MADSNLRDRPDMGGTVVGVLQPGTAIFVEATEGDWARLDPGAWIHLSLIRVD